MKRNLLKAASLLLVTALLSGTAVGCSSKKDNTSDPAATTTAEATKGPPVEIKIPVYERGNQGQSPADNSYWSKWIQENALKDINVKVTYVPIPRTQDVDKFNMLLAANEAPDVIFSYDYPTISAFYGRGAFQEIPKDVLEKNGPNLVKTLGPEILKYGEVNGKQYYLPAKRPTAYNYVSVMRQDWLDKVGMQAPKTMDEYYQVLKAFKEKDPAGVGSANIIPATFTLTNAKDPVTNYQWRPDNLSEEEFAMYSDVAIGALPWAADKERLKFYNKLFNEGLISPEFALDKDGKKAEADFMNGKAGVFGFFLSSNPPIIQTLLKNVSTAKLVVTDYNRLQKDKQSTGRAYWPFGMLSGINKSSKNMASVIKFYDWMSKPEISSVLQNGIEGKNYTKTNGVNTPVAGFNGEERLLNGTNKDYWCLVTEAVDLGSDEANMKADAAVRAPEGFAYLMEDTFKITKANKQIPDFLFDKPVAALTKNQKTLQQKYEEACTKLIMAKPGEFDKLYDQLVKDYLASGYQEILTEKQKLYRDMKAAK